jgi:hypothetical protein
MNLTLGSLLCSDLAGPSLLSLVITSIRLMLSYVVRRNALVFVSSLLRTRIRSRNACASLFLNGVGVERPRSM